MSTVPVFAPDGTLGDIPYERLHEALAAGAKIGINVSDPQGNPGVIPADRYQEALKAGAKILPLHGGPDVTMTGGAGKTMMEDIGSVFSGKPMQIPDMAEAGRVANYNEKAAGHGLPYRVGAAAATGLGANVPAMEQAQTPGEVLGHAGAAIAPYAAGAAIGGIGEALQPVARGAAERLYRSALKPTTAGGEAMGAKVQSGVQAAIQSEIPVSPAGRGKLLGLIQDLQDAVTEKVQNAPPGASVNRYTVAGKLSNTASRFGMQVNPEQDIATVGQTGREFLETNFPGSRGQQPGKPAIAPQPTGVVDPNGNPIMTSGRPAQPPTPAENIPIQTAQEIKKGTYARIGSRNYGEEKTAQVEAEKALASGLREEIAKQIPGLNDLNAKESAFLNLDPLIEKAIRRISNRQTTGIGTPIAAAAASAVTGKPAVGLLWGIMRGVLETPEIKSRLAIALNKRGVALPSAIGRIAAYSDAVARSAENELSQTNATQENH